MPFFKLPFSRHSRKPTPVVATDMALDSWCHQSLTQPSRFVHKIELCTALAVGRDAWWTIYDHRHTLLRVSLDTAQNGVEHSDDTLLIERVLSSRGFYHSVARVSDTLSCSGTAFHPGMHDDRIVVTSGGHSNTIARYIEVQRTLTFGDGKLSLSQFAQIIAFVSRMTKILCERGVCSSQSRSFAFTCLAAFTPILPPRELEEIPGAFIPGTSRTANDSVFELTAEAFLGQVPWLVCDSDDASWQAIGLIDDLKYAGRRNTRERLYQ